ncbi:hypothetical protein FXO37_17234 [Capsicum annuum]|nr:hypothetical protein FXO37_17234 [Capsicum annuum]
MPADLEEYARPCALETQTEKNGPPFPSNYKSSQQAIFLVNITTRDDDRLLLLLTRDSEASFSCHLLVLIESAYGAFGSCLLAIFIPASFNPFIPNFSSGCKPGDINDLVIYEINVRAFTADETSGLDLNQRGSYLGLIEKIPHLLELGVNAVELLPVFEFDELEFQRRPNPRDHMLIYDDYSFIRVNCLRMWARIDGIVESLCFL